MTTTSRGLTTREQQILLLASEHCDGRAFAYPLTTRERLFTAGYLLRWIEPECPPRYYITTVGRLAVRHHGSSKGRA